MALYFKFIQNFWLKVFENGSLLFCVNLFFQRLANGFLFIGEFPLHTSGGGRRAIVDDDGVDIDNGAGCTDFFQIF